MIEVDVLLTDRRRGVVKLLDARACLGARTAVECLVWVFAHEGGDGGLGGEDVVALEISTGGMFGGDSAGGDLGIEDS